MDIFAEITGIKYEVKCANDLPKIDFQDFDINKCAASCLVFDDKKSFALSKWVSPKRSRSYPFERVYNTLNISKKITVIPIIKDEGFDGDRDFIQWDTISLMSLIDVYVIFAYYNKAEKSKNYANKISSQLFDNQYVSSKIEEISSYHSSALHWNLKEVNIQNFDKLIQKIQESYSTISAKTKVKMHEEKGIETFRKQFENDVNFFKEASREKAKAAQNREQLTQQPKEVLTTLSKATITIKNFLGGLYFLTTDEVRIEKNNLFLIESKHSKNGLLPSKSDIKGGLFKMILYCNLTKVVVNDTFFTPKPILNLTSTKVKGKIKSDASQVLIDTFLTENNFKKTQIDFLKILFEEAKANNFQIILQSSNE